MDDHYAPKVVLLPGGWYFSHREEHVETLLGSCVAVTMWSHQDRVGGMCHIVLPGLERPLDCNDTRFAKAAIGRFVNQIRSAGLKEENFEVGLYGGGSTVASLAGRNELIGSQNVAATKLLLSEAGFSVRTMDVGGRYYRRLKLTLRDGRVDLQRGVMNQDTQEA
jgi:chemotaxis protein CheD